MSGRRRLSLPVGLIVAVLLLVPLDVFAAQISLAWDPSPDQVAGYKVYYGTAPSPDLTGTSVNVGNQTTVTIPGLSSGVTYYFVVKAYTSAGLESAPSNQVDGLAVTLPFTDEPLVPGVHSMRTLHMTELRARIDSLRSFRGLPAITWTPLVAGDTTISVSHISELRTALAGVYGATGVPAPTYLDNPLTPGTPIKAVHIVQLRAAVQALE